MILASIGFYMLNKVLQLRKQPMFCTLESGGNRELSVALRAQRFSTDDGAGRAHEARRCHSVLLKGPIACLFDVSIPSFVSPWTGYFCRVGRRMETGHCGDRTTTFGISNPSSL
ncbi:hypothetical protein PsorP6_007277 [Peronosclerospora sorghi]|uniref:Uncharacterized protein n=1 Tax=Peronosclerospora sorghi TaxID=230839 RepID=A0ACC0W8F8_9STRA|nr:hypothetical protein PsorP6_007277 [Peronosclerospora sorghi]